MKILVTGNSGFIGSHLLNDLNNTNHDVITYSRSNGQDLNDLELLEETLKDVELVIHCAGYAHAHTGSNDQLHDQLNYQVVINLLNAMEKQNVPSLIFLSSVKALQQDCAYGRAKYQAEQSIDRAVKSGKIRNAISLRLAMVYGPRSRGNLERMINLIQKGWFPPLPETRNQRSLVYIKDVVTAIKIAIQHLSNPYVKDASVYLVANPQTVSAAELYQEIRQALHLSKKSWTIPPLFLSTVAAVCSFVQNLTGYTLPFNKEVLDKLLGTEVYLPTIGAPYIPGWVPAYSLEQGLRETIPSNKDYLNP